MPRHAPPPYTGDQCRNVEDGEEHDLDISRLGRFYGQCSRCREKRIEEQRVRRGGRVIELEGERDLDGMRAEVTARSQQRPKLRAACEELTTRADRLEEALADRDAATLHAGVVLREFKEALQQVGRTAQSLLNGSRHNGDHPD